MFSIRNTNSYGVDTHSSANTTKTKPSSDDKSIKCYYCHKKGHFASQCKRKLHRRIYNSLPGDLKEYWLEIVKRKRIPRDFVQRLPNDIKIYMLVQKYNYTRCYTNYEVSKILKKLIVLNDKEFVENCKNKKNTQGGKGSPKVNIPVKKEEEDSVKVNQSIEKSIVIKKEAVDQAHTSGIKNRNKSTHQVVQNGEAEKYKKEMEYYKNAVKQWKEDLEKLELKKKNYKPCQADITRYEKLIASTKEKLVVEKDKNRIQQLNDWITSFTTSLNKVKYPFQRQEENIKGAMQRCQDAVYENEEKYKKCLNDQDQYVDDNYDDYCKEGLPEEDQDEEYHADSAEEMAELFD